MRSIDNSIFIINRRHTIPGLVRSQDNSRSAEGLSHAEAPAHWQQSVSLFTQWFGPRSYERNLSNCVWRILKTSRFQRGLNRWPHDPGVTLLPTELWSHWLAMNPYNCKNHSSLDFTFAVLNTKHEYITSHSFLTGSLESTNGQVTTSMAS